MAYTGKVIMTIEIDDNGNVNCKSEGTQIRVNGQIIPKQPTEFAKRLTIRIQQEFIAWMMEGHG